MKLSVRDFALKMVGRRELSLFELEKKLKDKFPEFFQEIESVKKEFLEKKWVSDDRFSERFIDAEIRRAHTGPEKIFQKLRQKGIDEDLARTKIRESISSDEIFESASLLAQRKKSQLLSRNFNETSYELEQKIVRFLVGKGYPFDLAMRVVKEKKI